MQTFKIIATDQKEYGPIPADVLCQWIAEKRAFATTLARAEGSSDWQPLAVFPEFAEALAATQPPCLPAGSIEVNPPISGPVKTSKLAIASLVCGLVGFLGVTALAGVVLGIIALVKINNSRGQLRGLGLAIAGLCLSGLMVLMVFPAALLLPALSQAKAKAQRIQCVTNLKQIGLAARIYSSDHEEIFPRDFLSMSNELTTPKILVCPADSTHTRASFWTEFSPGQHLTYEYLKPGIAESNAMDEVIFRCPIHNNVSMGDGSVQMQGR